MRFLLLERIGSSLHPGAERSTDIQWAHAMGRQSNWVSTMESRIRDVDFGFPRKNFCADWLETLLKVPNYSCSKGIIYFCVDCHNGMYSKAQFQDGAEHSRHAHFPVCYVNQAIIVHTALMVALEVDVSDVHSITHCGHYYNYLHSHSLHFLEAGSASPMEHKCTFCAAPISPPFAEDEVKYCSLECKFFSLSVESSPSKQRCPTPQPVQSRSSQKPTSRGGFSRSGKTQAAKDSHSPNLPHSETSTSDSSGTKQSVVPDRDEGLGGDECENNASPESSTSDPSTRSSCDAHSSGCWGSDTEPIETTHNELPFLEKVHPAEMPLLFEYLEQAPTKYLLMDTRLGILGVFAIDKEEREDFSCRSQCGSRRSDNGVLKRAAILFKSYIESNPPKPSWPLEEDYSPSDEHDEDLADENKPDLQLDEMLAAASELAGDSIDSPCRTGDLFHNCDHDEDLADADEPDLQLDEMLAAASVVLTQDGIDIDSFSRTGDLFHNSEHDDGLTNEDEPGLHGDIDEMLAAASELPVDRMDLFWALVSDFAGGGPDFF